MSEANAVGIVSLGVHIPRLRLSRQAIAQAHAWANPNLKSLGTGTRAICSHDEDSITMAVSAVRAALDGVDKSQIGTLLFASTSMPFLDRQNAAIVGEAVALADEVHTADFAGSQRAGTSALIQALQGAGRSKLVVASDRHVTKPGSTHEMTAGDGAAALLIGRDNLLARFVGAHSLCADLIDHYRSQETEFDYRLEERWIRDAGHLNLIPTAIGGLLTKTGLAANSIRHLVIAGVDTRVARTIAKQCGIDDEAVVDSFREECGETGCAHGLLMLAHALQRANPGERILAIGFGQGCDALLFEATADIARARGYRGVTAALERGIADDNYLRFLSFTKLVPIDWGLRAERDNRTAHSSFFRHRRSVTSFIGGRCTHCGAVQFPKTRACANPECRVVDQLEDEPFADKIGEVKSFTEDWLAHSLNPPFKYGNVRFAGGAVVMMEFTDVEPGGLRVGMPLQLQFRIKDSDAGRGFHRYFWKASPLDA